MKAVIMAGGLGKRLRPLTYSIPKPLLPVGKKPILEIIIGQLHKAGFNDIILTVGYKAELIQAYFRNGSNFGVNISYIKEPQELGTAGSLKLISDVDKNPFLVINGDILTKLNFKTIMDYHFIKKVEMTVGVVSYNVQVPYGVINTMENGLISNIEEKPTHNYFISSGIYVLNPEIIEFIPNNTFYGIPHLINKLIEVNKKVSAYHIKEDWVDIGAMDDLEKAILKEEYWDKEEE